MTPEHYNKSIQPIEFMRATLTMEEFRGFLKGNIIKYISRAEGKGGIDDYQKAMVYLKWLIEYTPMKKRCGEHWGEQNGNHE